MNSKKITYLFLLFFSLAYSQEKLSVSQILKKTSEYYAKNDYLSVTTKYTLFTDYTTKIPETEYSGMIVRKGNVEYYKIYKTEFIDFKDVSLKINHEQKAVAIQRVKNANDNSPLEINQYLKGFNYKLESKKDEYICYLTPSARISQIMFHKIVLYISKTDYSIKKQIFFMIEKMDSKDKNGKNKQTVPRLEVVFTARKKIPKEDAFLLNRDNYFTEKGQNITMSKKLASYQIYKPQ